MNWRSIRLELASTRQFPAGSVSRTYLIRVPLDESDAVDEAAVLANPACATVRRHWSTEPDEQGFLVKSGADWALRCDGRPDRTLRLDGTPLRLGSRVSLLDIDGAVLPLRVSSIR